MFQYRLGILSHLCYTTCSSKSITTVAVVVHLDHPLVPFLVAPLHETVKEAEEVDEPQVELQVVDQGAVCLALPAQLD